MQIFSSEEQNKIVHAISLAEGKTSGEVRLVIERKVKDASAYEAAVRFFNKLDMHKTLRRNGVLIYLAVDDHAFAIIGDQGIHEHVGDDFWQSTKETMVQFFRNGDLVSGLIAGITQAGDQLKQYFPVSDDDVNELPDDIYFGKN